MSETSTESELPDLVINVADATEEVYLEGEHWGHAYKVLTPGMRPRNGRLGVNQTRLPPGRAACPFHTHQLEDEVFFVVSGRGILRYGDSIREIGPGDCISCPAATGIAHQIANPFAEDLIYLAIGNHEPNEVCTYPDNGKIFIRSQQTIGHMRATSYMDGEPDRPRIFDIHAGDE